MNSKSRKIVEQKGIDNTGGFEPQGEDVVDRLYRDATTRLEKTFFNSMENDNPRFSAAGGGTQYQPNISQSSKWISEQSNMFNGNLKDFHARQEAFLQKQ